jgi:hypothetical protein
VSRSGVLIVWEDSSAEHIVSFSWVHTILDTVSVADNFSWDGRCLRRFTSQVRTFSAVNNLESPD